MTSALITGGTGFIGRRLAIALQEQGWNVTVFGRNKVVGEQLEKMGISFIEGDLRDETGVSQACKNQHTVFHSGALSSPWGEYRDFYDINVKGTQHVIRGCEIHDIQRLVHVSTPSIYFNYTDRLGISETAPLPRRPANAYADTKRKAELEVGNAHARGLSTVIIRPRAVYGPGDTTLLPRLIEANNHGGVPLFRAGNITLDLTYVDNVVDALILCALAPAKACGQAYNISNGEPVTLINVLRQLFIELNQPLNLRNMPYPIAYGLAAILEWKSRISSSRREPLLTRYTVGVLAKHQTLDLSLARDQLGYSPRIDMEEGIRLFAEWWKAK
ncbi:nucleoside-diphosphate-sugar epimerase [Paenibacillus sp. DS2015]|uniref:NAD-dependent epimerase/dehydratase family protein n=1 Tax=Paenibacillus sp. DS2015 TaxID=3373917 RepID=UPI003D1ACC49